jgi:hypothetical protein
MPDSHSLWSERRADSPHGWLASPAPIAPRPADEPIAEPPAGGRLRWWAPVAAVIGAAGTAAVLLEALR